jgi:hypothetical protein
MNSNALDSFALVTLLIMVVALPLLGIWDFRRLTRWVDEGRSDARIRTYNYILAMEWGLTLAFLAWWLGAGRNLDSLGLIPKAAGWQWLPIGLGLAGVMFMIYQMKTVMGSPEQLADVRDKMGELGHLAPQTPGEDRLFVLVSITAGVCEEVLYRGFLLAVLTPVTGIWAAVALTSVIFGLAHAYQGGVGIGKTALVGLVMALLTVFSGSLFIAILLHAIVDLTSGRMMGRAITVE